MCFNYCLYILVTDTADDLHVRWANKKKSEPDIDRRGPWEGKFLACFGWTSRSLQTHSALLLPRLSHLSCLQLESEDWWCCNLYAMMAFNRSESRNFLAPRAEIRHQILSHLYAAARYLYLSHPQPQLPPPA